MGNSPEGIGSPGGISILTRQALGYKLRLRLKIIQLSIQGATLFASHPDALRYRSYLQCVRVGLPPPQKPSRAAPFFYTAVNVFQALSLLFVRE